jgi:hypothetical protein
VPPVNRVKPRAGRRALSLDCRTMCNLRSKGICAVLNA